MPSPTLQRFILAATLPLLGGDAGGDAGRVQVLPAGRFRARDGRPGPGRYWNLSDAQGRALAERINRTAALTPLVIDYEHQTLHASTNGRPAPAAGWIDNVAWEDGRGLFATVRWTDAARAAIRADEYRFFSPVLVADDSGAVLDVLMGALVNYPALIGMQAAQALSAALAAPLSLPPPAIAHEDPDMALLASLLALLTLQPTATEAEALSAVQALRTRADQAATPPPVPTALVTALGLAAGATEAAALSAIQALRTPTAPAAGAAGAEAQAATLAMITALQGEVTALRAQATEATLVGLVDGAIAAGRFLPALREQLLQVGRRDLAALQGMVAAAPPIPGLAGQATAGAAAAAGAPAADQGLQSAEALRIAALMGITPQAWAQGITGAAPAAAAAGAAAPAPAAKAAA